MVGNSNRYPHNRRNSKARDNLPALKLQAPARCHKLPSESVKLSLQLSFSRRKIKVGCIADLQHRMPLECPAAAVPHALSQQPADNLDCWQWRILFPEIEEHHCPFPSNDANSGPAGMHHFAAFPFFASDGSRMIPELGGFMIRRNPASSAGPQGNPHQTPPELLAGR